MPGFQNYTQIAVLNRSTIISDVDGSNMVAALNVLLPTFCSDWSITPVNAIYLQKASNIRPENVYYIYLMDTSDVSAALAYHDLLSDVPYGKVFAKTVLSNGGAIMYEPTLQKSTVAQALAHEVFELLIDPKCNTWWMNNDTGVLFSSEVSDPVESNVVVVTLPNNVKVGMSDWILPSWSNVQNKIGPFNHLNTVTAPFQIKNGYAIVIRNAKVTNVYGESITPNTNSHSHTGIRHLARVAGMVKC